MSERTLESHAPAGHSALVRLAVMMFCQYAVWGIWLPYLANYLTAAPDKGGLAFTGAQMGWILGLAGSIGALAAPFIAGQVADRLMNAERALALLLLTGGIVKFITAYMTDYQAWLGLSILYSVLYMPTLTLTNSVAFANLDDPEKKFPPVRSLGTIGWIVASNLFPIIWLATDDTVLNTHRIVDSLKISGVMSALYALYCLIVLPKTPPKKDVEHPLAFARAFGLLAHRSFLVLVLVTLPISTIHQCFFFRVGPFFEHGVAIPLWLVGPALSIGQGSEIVFLAVLGLFIKRIGYKGVLALGCAGYLVRFAIFGLGGPAWLVLAAQTLHGVCYACFFAAAYLYVERIAAEDIRHSAQTVYGIMILGVGPILAGWYNQYFDRFQVAGPDGVMVQQYHQFWYSMAVVGLACAVAILLFF